MESIAALDDIVAGGGMTAADKANLAEIEMAAATADRGRREAVQQNMQMRGIGNELLAQLQSSQGATNRQAQQGLDVAGMAQNRALDSIMQSGQLAGNVRGQDWGEQGQRASALDTIGQFNTANTYDANKSNTAIQNAQQDANIGLKQQGFENRMGVAQGKAGVHGAEADYWDKLGNRKSTTKGNILTGGAKTAASMYGA